MISVIVFTVIILLALNLLQYIAESTLIMSITLIYFSYILQDNTLKQAECRI